ncbi:hypothetical protein HOM13_01590 [Candidatus Woesearchaeota archaeon]|jgi:hypothetical protein|nr:hypothetical protein [Candidatus Woesearchaeota archaeon]MBT5215408.1 hypothetical protein [Candidatus Woesearchaeota archaeon]MBT6401913.1 hypothetical protein [Candidatus Woesearchaeota archaeon]
MKPRIYTLVTTTGENYCLKETPDLPSWLIHERFKVEVPVEEGKLPQSYRIMNGKRVFRDGNSKGTNWYNFVGFLKRDVPYQDNILEITGNKTVMVESLMAQGMDEHNLYGSIRTIDDLLELKGCRPWLIREGGRIATAHHRILPVVADILEGWTIKESQAL